ncbi:TetR/AcrR family transcriptional regulator [Mesobacterium pallidum]|uniref:TetR/AcrR family transcriptional regulator n=1 Tax=Mesobacterium pallidum TaxID=2872037 RepID=UPI001EE16AC7|nr:TetR/AcrR family transcriptional regulator [Mesobacterium pallidum]
MALSARETPSTRQSIIDAARHVLMRDGFSGLSTRAVAEAAKTQMSQIRYHFGSKDGMILALFADMTERLILRQTSVFEDPEIPLSEKWALSCDFLDQDLDSGYVRVLQELIAVGWSNPAVGDAVRASFGQLRDLHVALAKDFADRIGGLGPFTPEDVAALVGSAFIGAETYLLLGLESDALPVRRALRRIGDLIAQHEPPNSAKD